MSIGNVGRSTASKDYSALAVALFSILDAARQEMGMSERLLSKQAGLNRTTLRKLRDGRSVLTVAELVSICAVLGLSPALVLDETIGWMLDRDVIRDESGIEHDLVPKETE